MPYDPDRYDAWTGEIHIGHVGAVSNIVEEKPKNPIGFGLPGEDGKNTKRRVRKQRPASPRRQTKA